jgi:hypothetical protein
MLLFCGVRTRTHHFPVEVGGRIIGESTEAGVKCAVTLALIASLWKMEQSFLACFGLHTANEDPVRINKCLVPIYVFPEMKLCCLVISKTELQYNVQSPSFHIHVSESNLYIPRIGLSILLQPKRQTDPGNM